MTRWWLAPEATEDLERLVDFLAHAAPEIAGGTVDLILDALDTLSRHPNIGRPMPQGLRELVISRGEAAILRSTAMTSRTTRYWCWPSGTSVRTITIDDVGLRGGLGGPVRDDGIRPVMFDLAVRHDGRIRSARY